MMRRASLIASLAVAVGVPGVSFAQSVQDVPIPAPVDIAEAPMRTIEEIPSENRTTEVPREPRPTPTNNPDAWITAADYPAEAWRAGKVGNVGYSLSIDAEGAIDACEIIISSGHSSLDKLTCDLVIERAEFAPATDQDGNPVASTWQRFARWRKDEPEFAETFRVKVRYIMDERGLQQQCTLVEVSEAVPESLRSNLRRRPCDTGDSRPGVPYRDENGDPVAREVTLEYQVTVAPVAE